MKVLHLNFYDIEGGAAIAMHRLHSLLKKSNSVNSNILVFSKKQKTILTYYNFLINLIC